MTLAIDIGNTHVVAGLFRAEKLVRERRIETSGLVSEPDVRRALGAFVPTALEGAIVSSVVPRLDQAFLKVIRSVYGCRPLKVSHRMDTGLSIDIDRPAELGADRIVNAAYGYHLYGGPLLLLDFGTATTLCAVAKDGRYLGGAILPGLKLGLEALASRAAKLRSIALDGPAPAIGRSTADSMRIGVVEGHAGAVLHLARRMMKELGPRTTVIATGGLSGFMAGRLSVVRHVIPDLTLRGLSYLYQRNR